MLRALLVLTLASAALLVPATRAAANGGAVFDFVDPYLEVGTEAHGSTVVWMSGKDPRALERGPFYAYVLPEGRWIKPPRIPTGAIRVGTVEFRWLTDRKTVTTVSFTVPDVPSGRYGFHYCNDPCTTAAVGDLYAGSVLIASDAEVGALLLEKEELQAKASSAEWRFKRAKRQIAKLEEAAADWEDARAGLIARVAELQGCPGPECGTPAGVSPESGTAAVVPLVAASGGGFVLGLAVRRRRRSSGTADGPSRPAVRELEPVS